MCGGEKNTEGTLMLVLVLVLVEINYSPGSAKSGLPAGRRNYPRAHAVNCL